MESTGLKSSKGYSREGRTNSLASYSGAHHTRQIPTRAKLYPTVQNLRDQISELENEDAYTLTSQDKFNLSLLKLKLMPIGIPPSNKTLTAAKKEIQEIKAKQGPKKKLPAFPEPVGYDREKKGLNRYTNEAIEKRTTTYTYSPSRDYSYHHCHHNSFFTWWFISTQLGNNRGSGSSNSNSKDAGNALAGALVIAIAVGGYCIAAYALYRVCVAVRNSFKVVKDSFVNPDQRIKDIATKHLPWVAAGGLVAVAALALTGGLIAPLLPAFAGGIAALFGGTSGALAMGWILSTGVAVGFPLGIGLWLGSSIANHGASKAGVELYNEYMDAKFGENTRRLEISNGIAELGPLPSAP